VCAVLGFSPPFFSSINTKIRSSPAYSRKKWARPRPSQSHVHGPQHQESCSRPRVQDDQENRSSRLAAARRSPNYQPLGRRLSAAQVPTTRSPVVGRPSTRSLSAASPPHPTCCPPTCSTWPRLQGSSLSPAVR
jgi:hypothetical protein